MSDEILLEGPAATGKSLGILNYLRDQVGLPPLESLDDVDADPPEAE